MNSPIRCKAIIFDFDGTLADSMPFLEKIGVQIISKYYEISEEDATHRYRSTTGLPYEHQIKMNFPDFEQNEEAIEEFEKLKIEKIYEQELFDDCVAMLKSISERGILIFVSSSTFQPTIQEYFKKKDLSHYFQEIVGYRPGFEKGADHFNHIKDTHRVSLDHVVFVGDSLKDYERSKGFCPFIGISRMFSEDDFRKAGHQGPVVMALSEIPDIIG
ncbi:MAG: HAD hydrolase-like protein [Candidatus Thorarchaeota archaeon]